MNTLVLELSDDQLEMLEQMTWYPDVANSYQSEEMEELGAVIRSAIEELE
jgi:hypothetical protein